MHSEKKMHSKKKSSYIKVYAVFNNFVTTVTLLNIQDGRVNALSLQNGMKINNNQYCLCRFVMVNILNIRANTRRSVTKPERKGSLRIHLLPPTCRRMYKVRNRFTVSAVQRHGPIRGVDSFSTLNTLTI